jgi:hypothetical protein
MRLAVATFAFPSILCAFAGQGLCQESSKPAEERSWYGYQIILSDVVACSAIGVAIPTENSVLGT